MAVEKKQYLDVTGLARITQDYHQVFVSHDEVQQTVVEGNKLPISSNGVFVELEDIREDIKSQMQFGTAEFWREHPEVIAAENCVYFYSDAAQVGDYSIARMKVGDGETLLKDLPFIDDLYYQHINDNDIHVSSSDRERWNNKMRAYMLPEIENLILTIN